MPIDLQEFDDLLARLEKTEGARAAIGVRDPAIAAYARVLEFGSLLGAKPWPNAGPRTTSAVDPETGTAMVVSAQAPAGFIRIHAAEMREAVASELGGVAGWLDPEELSGRIASALRAATTSAVAILRSAVPRDSGELARAIEKLDAE